VKIAQLILGGMIAVLTFAGATDTVIAAEYGGGNVQSYTAKQPIDYGAIVELVSQDTKEVKVASKDKLQNMFGVVIDPQQIPIRISNGEIENETYVAVTGTYNVLVSTESGEIAAGDYITLSSINGIGMKAGTEDVPVLGRAVSGFSSGSVSRGSAEIKDVDGNLITTAKLGSIPLTIEVQRNPNEKSTKAKVPEALERIGQAIAEKEVSAIRIYISLAITAVSLVTALLVLYTGVRSSVISIGRNPMSKRSILRALLQIILASFLILVIGLFAVYLLLRL
jgi:hypothetical protein